MPPVTAQHGDDADGGHDCGGDAGGSDVGSYGDLSNLRRDERFLGGISVICPYKYI